MQIIRVTGTAALFLLFGTMVPALRSTTGRTKERASLKSSRVGRSRLRRRPRNSSALRVGRNNRRHADIRTNPRRGTNNPLSSAQQPRLQERRHINSPRSSKRSSRTTATTAATTSAGPRNLSSTVQQPPQQRAQQPPPAAQGNTPSRSGNNSNRNAPSNRLPRGNSSGDGYSRAAAGRVRAHGSRVVRNGGKASIAPGPSVEAMAATTSLRPASVSISGVNTRSGCPAAPRSTWAIRASRTAAIRSCSWIRGRNTGSENWYATDDVYIDYDDGYYLYNRRYPSVRLAVRVAL